MEHKDLSYTIIEIDDSTEYRIKEDLMKKKDLLKTLELNETIAEFVAEQHNDHDCTVGAIARVIRDSCHDARELLSSTGPAQVATKQYRTNWDTIFGKRQTVGQT